METAICELQQISDERNRVPENIKALGDSAAEKRLLERHTRQLEEQEARVDALEKAQSDLQGRQAKAERELNEPIAAHAFDVIREQAAPLSPPPRPRRTRHGFSDGRVASRQAASP